MAQIAVLATGVLAALNRGHAGYALGYDQAEALRDASMRRMAATTAEVSEAMRDKELMQSRITALAAFQGGGADDPTMVKLKSDLNAEGQYRIMSKLYTGADEAQALQYQSEQAMNAGDAALDTGYVNSVTTVLSAWAGGMFDSRGLPAPSHSVKASRSYLGTMDFNPSSGAAVYG